MKTLYHFGQYFILLNRVFRKPEKWKVFFRSVLRELENLGVNSVGIVMIISFFIGAVLAIQTAYNMENPLLPNYLIGLMVRDTMLLEFSSTIIALILAGKAGSSICSEIGTMRISEQIDAIEIMGVNSASYLILPKIVAAVLFFPLLSILSMFVGVFGGWITVIIRGLTTNAEYIEGLHYSVHFFYIAYSLTKMAVFAFIIATVPAYQGYFVNGGSLEVGKASTRSVVYSSILVLLFNLILTQLLL